MWGHVEAKNICIRCGLSGMYVCMSPRIARSIWEASRSLQGGFYIVAGSVVVHLLCTCLTQQCLNTTPKRCCVKALVIIHDISWPRAIKAY